MFIKFEPDTEEEIKLREEYNRYKKIITSTIYKKLYDSKKLNKESMKIIYSLLKEDLYG